MRIEMRTSADPFSARSHFTGQPAT